MNRILLAIAVCLGLTFSTSAQTADYLQTEVLADHLTIPWDLEWGPDNKIWFMERNGRIASLDPETGIIEDIYQISDVYESWDNSGAHAFALHPDFPFVPYVFVNYTYGEFGGKFVRYTYSIERGTLVSEKVLIEHLSGNSSHNGSRIAFDKDGYLYLCTGDAFAPGFSQDLENLAGKVLKMDSHGNPAPGNPFNSLVWSYGHRNPQGLTFSDDGKLYSAEHGPATDDEVNLVEMGRNYGWPDVKGFCDLPSEQGFCEENDVMEPLAIWTPTEAPCQVQYFNHPSIPEWEHSLLVTFLKAKQLKVLKLNEEGDAVESEDIYFQEEFGRIREVLIAPNGRVFIATSNQEPNGSQVVVEDDDKIIEVINPNYSYPDIPGLEFEGGVTVFPQPATGYINVPLDAKAQTISYRISDLNGRYLRERFDLEVTFRSLYSIDVSDLPSGMYVLEMETDVSGVVSTNILIGE